MQRPLILIVDPDRDSRIAWRSHLEGHGYPYLLDTADGAAGLRLVRQLGPDLVIGDFPLDVPGHSPFLQALREEIRSDVPVIAVTSAGGAADLAGLEGYCAAVIPKTAGAEEIGAAVERILNRLEG